MTRVVCHQLSPRIGEQTANHRQSVLAIHEAVSAGADVVVLPELVTSGYVFESRAEAESLAITSTHPLFGEWAAAAAQGSAVVIGGFCERGDNGNLYNSAAAVDASGVRAVYRKTHLWDREKLFFTPGDEPPPVLQTSAGRLGVLICYDLEFPEVTRALALAGAELLAIPANWPLVRRPADEHPPEVVIAMAAARTNRVVIACCDRTGSERGQDWTAGTTIIDESGWVVATVSHGRQVACADVDLERTRDKRISERNDALLDRRPELYARLQDDRRDDTLDRLGPA